MVEARGALIKTLAMIVPSPDANRGPPADAIKHGIAVEHDLQLQIGDKLAPESGRAGKVTSGQNHMRDTV
jgi:hypothetical protein